MALRQTSLVDRVVWIASEYPPFVYGGLGTHVFELTRALAGAGLPIDLVVPHEEGYADPPDGVALHPVPVASASSNWEYWLRFSHGALVAAQVNHLGDAVVHCHDWMTGLAGAALGGVQASPCVLTIHLPQVEPMHVAMENLAMAAVDRVVVNSAAVDQEILGRGLPGVRPVVIPNGVDTDRFKPGAEAPAGQRVLYVGRLVAQKGVDWLMKGFAVAAQRLPEMRLILVGDGDHKLYLLRLARHLGISGRVTFAGWKTGEELVREYQRASVVVVPSWYEPFGIVALEAMACGRPVITSRAGGLQELVVDGTNGFTVEPGDYLQLAARLVQVVVDGVLASRLQSRGRETALRYSWESVAAGTLALYEELVQDRRAPSRRAVRKVFSGVGSSFRGFKGTEVDELLRAVQGHHLAPRSRGDA